MSARGNILARLRRAPVMPSDYPFTQETNKEVSSEILLQQFQDNIKEVHAEVIDLRKGSLREELAVICDQKNIQNLMLPPYDFLALIPWNGGPKISRFNQPIELLKNDLFNTIDAGITIADGAIADTGTLIQSNPIRMPRTLSLVPPIHICILDARRIYSNMQAALQSNKWNEQIPSNLIFITGPSKTADIQLTLAYGAHGPRELIVILMEDI